MAIVKVRKARYDRLGIEHCVDCVGYAVGGRGIAIISHIDMGLLSGTMSCGAWWADGWPDFR
jgi:hypothetical protein